MKKKYDHAISFNFTLKSDNEIPTREEILDKLRNAVNNLDLNDENIFDSVEIFDTHEND